MSPKSHPKQFRSDIEGLRALAILSVVVYHTGETLPGGFLGVDVFFVISGFLITGILLREHAERGRVDLVRFWARRVRRILPQATLALVAIVTASYFLLPPLLVEPVGEDVLRASYFWLNWRAAGRAVDYSDPGSDLTPVLHYWSLGVEEQFYLVWPVLLAAILMLCSLRSYRKGLPLISILAGGIVVSMMYCAVLTTINQPLAFFSTLSRTWELLSGAAIAVVVHRGANCPDSIANWLAVGGLILILGGFLFVGDMQAVPFPAAVVAVSGAVSVIFAGTSPTGNVVPRILSVPPLPFIGRVSYAWYVWHWPVFFFGWLLIPLHSWTAAGLMAVISFGIAVVTFYLVEQPARFNEVLQRSNKLSLALGLLLVAIGVVAARMLISHADDLSVQLSNGERLMVSQITADRSRAYKLDCHASQRTIVHPPCEFGAPGAATDVVLFGDSHAAQFFDPLAAAAQKRGVGLLMRSKSGCPAISASLWNAKYKRLYSECEQWKEGVLATIAEKRPRLIILSSATAYKLVDPNTGSILGNEQSTVAYTKGLLTMVERLLQYAERVVIVEDTPRLPEEPVNCLARNDRNEDACQWPLNSVSSGGRFMPDLSGLDGRAVVVDLNDRICPMAMCRAILDGKPVLYDTSHLSRTYSMDLTPDFEEILARAGL